jgi:hypothetical protein
VHWLRLVFILLALAACQNAGEPPADGYAADIDAICNQEERSGALKIPAAERDPLVAAHWLERNVKTPEGRKFAASVFQLEPSEKGPALRAEAQRVGLPACPTADAWK